MYLFFHPKLWGKDVQLCGIPHIWHIEGLHIGRYVALNDKVSLQCVGGIYLGDCVTISYGCTILAAGLDSVDYPNRCMVKNRDHIFKSVTIGEGTWLCANVTVCPGVVIPPRFIIGAGAVVAKSLEMEGWLYAGFPAKPIRPLNKV